MPSIATRASGRSLRFVSRHLVLDATHRGLRTAVQARLPAWLRGEGSGRWRELGDLALLLQRADQTDETLSEHAGGR
ncbi:hypothetical protein [Streptomyces sp. NPDC003006]